MFKGNRLLYLLAFIKLISPFILQDSYYQPHRDEFLYLAEGHHMAWGYMEVPPVLSVFAWITNFFGATMFWIKIWPALFGVFTFLLVGKTVLSLGGKAFALILAWLPFMIDGYMRLFFLFQPNFLEVFFWTLIGYSIVRYIQTEKVKWVYIFGIAVGLGMMSKYSVAFITLSILAGLLLTRHRKIFLNKHFYYAALIAFFIFLPNLTWQYNHRFPVVAHMQELQEEQLQFISPINFIASQFLMNLPCVFTWVAGILFVCFTESGKAYRFYTWAYLFVITLLIVLHGKDYYALGIYPLLFAFGGVCLEQATAFKWKWTRYAMLLFSVGLGLYIVPMILPVAKPDELASYYEKTGFKKLNKWEDQQIHPLPQDFADMIGWKEMAQQAGTIYNSLSPEEKSKTMVYCRGYFTAGALNYYRKEVGLPEVYSDNASFLLWMPDKYDIHNLLFVGHRIPDKDDIVFQQFEKMTVKDSVTMPLFRETGTKFILFEKANDSLKAIIEKGVAGLKSRFIR
ncbi:MAG: glycosyltransferase family 39 protein [Bacteroidetes bacterium]|nr:glycosyltransferase family 39 protein [Bacteroidota bacterium]